MIRWIIFAMLSLPLVIQWWPYKVDLRHHGFFRFFAFETVLALVFINIPYWFNDPLRPIQIISWVLLLISIVLVIHGLNLLHRLGESHGTFEDTTVIVRDGAYKYIRHPMYASLFYLAWGAFLKHISLWSSLLLLVALTFVIVTAKIEEAENIAKFGDSYTAYIHNTKMFVPFIF